MVAHHCQWHENLKPFPMGLSRAKPLARGRWSLQLEKSKRNDCFMGLAAW